MLDIVVIGAGFGGLYALHRLRELGFSVRGIEGGSDVGGAWYWNRYPGARCDVESLVYSYTFSPEVDREWRWTERYAAQPEIQRYIAFVADRLDLRSLIDFSNHVESAIFDKGEDCWRIRTDKGLTYTARHIVLATGPISKPILPDLPGIDTFEGTLVHTARWPKDEPDFAGKKVGVIGTGSSGIQTIPMVAEQAEKLTVFLRTANFTVPARNVRLSDDDIAQWHAQKDALRAGSRVGMVSGLGDVLMPEEMRASRMKLASDYTPEQRRDIMERLWDWGGGSMIIPFADTWIDPKINDEVADFQRDKIRETVKDPKVAELLVPRGFYLGTKRVCVGTNYYETYNRDNVELVDIKANPIERVTAKGVVVDGVEHPLDYLIFATGFDALTGALTSIELRGEDGRSINEVWAEGPETYLGLVVRGFPNMFMLSGPGSPSVLSNVVQTNEFQVDLIGRLLSRMRDEGKTHLDVESEAQVAWSEHVREVVTRSLFGTTDSWYVGANVPGKPRVILPYAGGPGAYRAKCEEIAASNFEGFVTR